MLIKRVSCCKKKKKKKKKKIIACSAKKKLQHCHYSYDSVSKPSRLLRTVPCKIFSQSSTLLIMKREKRLRVCRECRGRERERERERESEREREREVRELRHHSNGMPVLAVITRSHVTVAGHGVPISSDSFHSVVHTSFHLPCIDIHP